MNYYTGNITPGKDIVFVFGSNPKAGTVQVRQRLPFKSLEQSMERAMDLLAILMR